MRYIPFLVILCFLFHSCGFGGTHGKIKAYSFNSQIDDLVICVDNFLLKHPNYDSKVNETSGWIYIKLPQSENQYSFRIGGHAQITLLTASKKNELPKLDKQLSYFKKQKFIKDFEENFISKLEVSPQKRSFKILRKPFTLMSNQHIDTTWWPHYVFKYDTLVSYPILPELKEMGLGYFQDAINTYSKHITKDIRTHQHFNLFRINTSYSGYLTKDSIYINAYYRVVGEKSSFEPLFENIPWKDYLNKMDENQRIEAYQERRKNLREKGFQETTVYNISSKEYWMEGIVADSLKLDQ